MPNPNESEQGVNAPDTKQVSPFVETGFSKKERKAINSLVNPWLSKEPLTPDELRKNLSTIRGLLKS